jgi:hypothetical protein
MNIKNLLVFFAVTSAIWVILFMFAPAQTMAFFGDFATNAVGLHMTRNLGAALAGYPVLAWLVRNESAKVQKLYFTATFISLALMTLAGVMGQASIQAGTFGWIGVAVFGLFAALFGYLAFRK